MGSEEEILSVLPEGFKVVVVPFGDKVKVYGDPKKVGIPHEERLAECLMAGANVVSCHQAKILSK